MHGSIGIISPAIVIVVGVSIAADCVCPYSWFCHTFVCKDSSPIPVSFLNLVSFDIKAHVGCCPFFRLARTKRCGGMIGTLPRLQKLPENAGFEPLRAAGKKRIHSRREKERKKMMYKF